MTLPGPDSTKAVWSSGTPSNNATPSPAAASAVPRISTMLPPRRHPGPASLAAAFPQIPLWRAAMAGYRVAVGETEAARRDLEALAVNDFRDVPRDMMWT